MPSSSHLSQKIYADQYMVCHRFPGPFGDRLITYADYIASGQPLRFIEEYIAETVLPTYANTHTEASFTGRQTGHFREEARNLIKQSVHAGAEDVLIFCGSGSTGAVDKLVRQINSNPAITPVVFMGPYEHHSNMLPWREGNFTIVPVPVTGNGLVDLVFLEAQLQQYQHHPMLIGTFSAASNVTGIMAPVDEITTLLHRYGALSLWDYAAGAPYMAIDMNPGGLANKDAIFISPHKLMGGPGTPGILVAKRHLFAQTVPACPGGGTVQYVTKTQQCYHADLEVREEAGTPDILGSIRAGLSFKVKDIIGTDYIQKKEHKFVSRAFDLFRQHPGIFILGNPDVPRLGFLAFLIRCEGRFLHHNFVVALLNDLFGIQARGGCSCAGPYGHDLLGISDDRSQAYVDVLKTGNEGLKPGWVRLNFNYFIPEEEFLFLTNALIWVAQHGWKLLKQYTFDDTSGLWHPLANQPTSRSLSSFLASTPEQKDSDTTDIHEERGAYLLQANTIAHKALSAWEATPVQRYAYPQVSNPLRWYALADDMPVVGQPA